MARTIKTLVPVGAAVVLGAVWFAAHPATQARPLPSTKNGDWTHYTAEIGRAHV